MYESKEVYSFLLQDYPDILDVEQLCTLLQIGKTTLYKLLKNGNIKSMRVGHTYRIPKLFLFEYFKITGF